jgi:hypothetical protein
MDISRHALGLEPGEENFGDPILDGSGGMGSFQFEKAFSDA